MVIINFIIFTCAFRTCLNVFHTLFHTFRDFGKIRKTHKYSINLHIQYARAACFLLTNQCHVGIPAKGIVVLFLVSWRAVIKKKTKKQQLGIVQSHCNRHNKCTDENPLRSLCSPNIVKYCRSTEAWKGHQDAKIKFVV